MPPQTELLYANHLHNVKGCAESALAAAGFDHLLIASGVEKYAFLDDRPYPFRCNPHFKAWLPLTRHPHCWLAFTPGERPKLAYYLPDDYWHLPPEEPAGYWAEHFDITIINDPSHAKAMLPNSGRTAIIGEPDAALPGLVPNNPQAIIDHLHYQRAFKTPYEQALMRRASLRAVRGHLAARAGFLQGQSELEIHRAYLAATGHTDFELPYGNIVALNAHGATLHYQYQHAERPARKLSLLIDAGADELGYAADITRTWTTDDGAFASLIAAVDQAQLALVDGVRTGTDYRELHAQAHHRLAAILQAQDIVRMSPESQVESGISATFFPHGLGHLLGLQVHDVAGFAASAAGGVIDKPKGHPYLRLTRIVRPGMALTIEPGIYFIDTLLAKLRAGPHAAAVNWASVEQLKPYGGIRIEDDVICTDGAPINLTRDAFAQLQTTPD
ncbi:MAG: Xaa-Pro dipeptidase [Gammaproteobacteria bacterium HGW-Gammaproteobacteria-2]|nr:MAG: Xaa-Pro dipeptidase [Gammaproteobacteria bacterium HGW-Gammaproteobacteria-2]